MRQRTFGIAFAIVLFAGVVIAPAREDPHANPPTITSDSARKMLIDGNARYRGNLSQDPHRDQARRTEVAAGQHPYAIILSCSDSRAPLEIVFDAGIGDLFVIRIAGNVAATDEIGTIEYGVEHLQAPLVLVLGHTKCGAVTAVVDHAHVSEMIGKLVAPIAPAVERARHEHPDLSGAPLVAEATKQNVWQAIDDICSHSKIVRDAIAAGKLQVIGGIYNIETGDIQWLDGIKSSSGRSDVAPTTQERDGAHGDPKKSSSLAPTRPRENFAALGALLFGAGVVSALAIRFMGLRRR